MPDEPPIEELLEMARRGLPRTIHEELRLILWLLERKRSDEAHVLLRGVVRALRARRRGRN